MGKYFCPTCSGGTDVIETRASNARIRRRRSCRQCKARFSTIEVPLGSHKELRNLAEWFGTQGLEEDMVDYAKSEVDRIILGKEEE